jgi:hypothetical protein
MGIQSFDEIAFSREANVGFIIIKITKFASTVIVGFDPRIVEVGDLAIGVMHAGFFIKVTIWIKTRKGAYGWQWTIIQTRECMFFFTISWPFGEN